MCGLRQIFKHFEEYPYIKHTNERVFSEETAYQVTSILEELCKEEQEKIKRFKSTSSWKTGTTNKNFDAWFIGYSSNLVIGVYVGFDNPKSLGKYETGSKAALPIFKEFVKNSLYKEDFKEFKIPDGIYLTSLDYDTGLKSSLGDKNTIIEALKAKDINNINNNKLITTSSYDKLIRYRQFY